VASWSKSGQSCQFHVKGREKKPSRLNQKTREAKEGGVYRKETLNWERARNLSLMQNPRQEKGKRSYLDTRETRKKKFRR